VNVEVEVTAPQVFPGMEKSCQSHELVSNSGVAYENKFFIGQTLLITLVSEVFNHIRVQAFTNISGDKVRV
jgi:hypothetical protein